jgi:hypothetical protein
MSGTPPMNSRVGIDLFRRVAVAVGSCGVAIWIWGVTATVGRWGVAYWNWGDSKYSTGYGPARQI